jgi:hypothetical protein
MKKPAHATVVAYVALFFAVGGSAFAATGGTLILGEGNRAGTRTSLKNMGDGPALALETAGSSDPVLSVQGNTTKIPGLNADLLDGASIGALQRRMSDTCPTLAGIRAVAASGAVTCTAREYRIFTESDSFIVPSGVTAAIVEVRGPGGGGGQGFNGGNGSGGGQGGFERALLTVQGGDSYNVTVGDGGAGGSAGTGGWGESGTATFVRRMGSTDDLARASSGVGGAPGDTCEAVAANGATSGSPGGVGLRPTAAASIGLSRTVGEDGGSASYVPPCPGTPIGGTAGGRGFAGAGGAGGSGLSAASGDVGSPGMVMVFFLH